MRKYGERAVAWEFVWEEMADLLLLCRASSGLHGKLLERCEMNSEIIRRLGVGG